MRAHVPGNSIGASRHLVTFEDPGDPVPDGEGGYTETWTPLSPATWYVRMRPATMKDAERVTAGTVITHVSHLVHGRYHPGVTTRSRMILGGEVYQVTSAVNLELRGREMELVADRSSHDQTPGPPPALAYADLIVADGASHYWRLGEPSGTITVDSVGTAHGTISGGVTLNQPGAISDGSTAMVFDGVTGKVITGTVAIVPPSTLECWMRTTSTTSPSIFGSRWQPPNPNFDVVVVNLAGAFPQLSVLFAGADPSNHIYSPVVIVNDGQWHHLTWVLAGGLGLQGYVDGVAVTLSGQFTQPPIGTTQRGLELGANSDWFGKFFPGTLDDVAIYPHALTPQQIAAHYTAATTARRRRR